MQRGSKMSYRRLLPAVVVLFGTVAVACGGAASSASPAQPPAPAPEPAARAAPEPTAPPAPESRTQPGPASEAGSQVTTPSDKDSGASPERPTPVVSRPRADAPPAFLTFGWRTDFSKHSVPYSEIRSGGPPRDGIPPIDNPKFIDVSDPPDYMNDNESVMSVEISGDARAYPLGILISHEIVNDEVGGVPVSVTYCPLCNTAIVFDRRVDGRVLDFGTSGNLRKSDLVMWDRQTESWWQQVTGEAIVGELTGTRLTFIAAPVVSWRQFRDAFPEGKVLSRDTGFARNYDLPPYSGYDEPGNIPFLFSGNTDPRLKAVDRVVGVTIDTQDVAYPFTLLEQHPVINDTVNGKELAIFYAGGTLSPFAGFGYSAARVVGSTAVYEPFVDGEMLTFVVEDQIIVDRQTGSKWNILGQAVDGPLQGSQLTPVVHGNHFWFAWAAFNPDTLVRTPKDIAG